MTFGSLFAGIGGFDLGLERAGMVCRWQVEIDDYCRRVLGKHWPDVQRYEDVKDVGAHNLEPVDLICGGFPCQDISYAGQGAGIGGARSGLWGEYARIIRELRPGYVIVENVPALLTRGMGRVLRDLARCGYDAEWSVVSACAMGAPHVRRRLFIVAYTNGVNGRLRVQELVGPHGLENPSELYGGAHGISHGLDRNRAIGNSVVPQLAEYIGRRIMEAQNIQLVG